MASRPIKRDDYVRSKTTGIVGKALHDERDQSLRPWEIEIVHVKANMEGTVFACHVDDLEHAQQ
jgi:hypothetical protein